MKKSCNILLAQEDVFDLIAGHEGQMWAMSLQGYSHNVREFEYIVSNPANVVYGGIPLC